MRAASLSAAVWAAAALALIPLTLSDTLGRPIGESISADWVISGISILDSVRAALIAAIVASLIAVLARVVLHPGWAAVLLGFALIAVIAQSNTGHSAQSGDHDVAVDTMVFHLVGISLWVGGLVALLGLARQRVSRLAVIAGRYSSIALWAFVAVAVSGFGNAWVRISYLPDLWLTDYGRLVLIKAGLLVTLGAIGYLHRKRTLPAITDDGDRRPLIRLAVVEVAVMAATIGVASALARTATPPPSGVVPSDIELALGYDLAGPPTFLRLVTDWRFDWILGVGAVAAAVVYLLAVRRVRGSGVRWPAGRTVAWVLGCAMVLVATSSGLGRYAEAQFSIHMMAHMLLGMIAPILLVLGGPITPRAACPPGCRSWRCSGASGGDRLRAAQPACAVHHSPVVRLPVVRLLLLRALLHLAVRGDDLRSPGSPGDEPAFPAGRLPVLLGDHRRRPGAAAAAADAQAGHADRRACRSMPSSVWR